MGTSGIKKGRKWEWVDGKGARWNRDEEKRGKKEVLKGMGRKRKGKQVRMMRKGNRTSRDPFFLFLHLFLFFSQHLEAPTPPPTLSSKPQ